MKNDFEVSLRTRVRKRKSFNIKTSTYTSQVSFLEQNIVYSNKIHYYKKNIHYQTYGLDWSISFGNLPPNTVKIRSGSELISLEGPTLIFHKPFSIIEFHIEEGPLKWGYVGSSTKCPIEISESTLITNQDFGFAFNQQYVVDMLKVLRTGKKIIQEKKVSALAEKLKTFLDKNYCEKAGLSEYAKKNRVSRVVMTRSFTQTYGISPIEYKIKLRIFRALAYMREGMSITESLYLVGFSNPSLFIRNFKNYLNASPHQYKSKVF